MFLAFDSVILLLGICLKKVLEYVCPTITQDKETGEKVKCKHLTAEGCNLWNIHALEFHVVTEWCVCDTMKRLMLEGKKVACKMIQSK